MFFVFLPQPLKAVQSRKYKYDKQHQISLFLLLSFVSTTFQGFFEARAEIQKYFRSFFGSNENFRICFRDLLNFSKKTKYIAYYQILDTCAKFLICQECPCGKYLRNHWIFFLSIFIFRGKPLKAEVGNCIIFLYQITARITSSSLYRTKISACHLFQVVKVHVF